MNKFEGIVLRANAVVREDDLGVHVDVIWSGTPLDRPSTGGYGLGPGKHKLAERLVRAINAQAVYIGPEIVKDINGKTYFQARRCLVLGRYINADLKRLGY